MTGCTQIEIGCQSRHRPNKTWKRQRGNTSVNEQLIQTWFLTALVGRMHWWLLLKTELVEILKNSIKMNKAISNIIKRNNRYFLTSFNSSFI